MTMIKPGAIVGGVSVLALLGAASLTLAACDGGASAVRTTQAEGGRTYAASAQAGAYSGPDHRKDPTPLLDGKPLWAANRQHSAEDNAAYHYKRDGASFGARSPEDYARIAQAFIGAPPEGSEVIKRPNGDKLIYDPRGNVFAVATAEGAPRALFKPKDGAAYWAKQKANANKPFGGKRKGGSGDSSNDSGDQQDS